jgi:N-acetylglucosamine kinase-like BadF-type ATPase
MILIADSGSTKTSWCFIDKDGKTTIHSTSGINPFFRTSEDIEKELQEKLVVQIPLQVNRICFYGAGVINEEKGNIVKIALQNVYPSSTTEVYSDLLAAVHATLGKTKGIACILGTGSNSCFFDGEKIAEHVPPLGFILGDEGSGAILGRKLLGDYLKGIMPGKLSEKFKEQFQFSYSELMEAVYRKEKPNLFLAGFVPFLKENIHEQYCANLVGNSFDEFVKRNIFSYSEFREVSLNFVGSVAYHFQEQLKKVLEQNQLQIGKVIKEPLNGLIDYYSEKKQ